MKKLFYTLIVSLTIVTATQAQHPWSKYGYEPKPALTLSNGEYQEFFTNDTIVQIGSVLFNTITNQVVAFVKEDTLNSETTLKPEITSRWLSQDPLAAKYPSISPYVFVNNNPIIYVDPDGREWTINTTVDNNGNETVFLKLTAVVVNESANKDINMNNFRDQVKGQIETTYSLKYTKTVLKATVTDKGIVMVPTKVDVTVITKVEVRVVNSSSEATQNEHVISIVNNSDLREGVNASAHEIGSSHVDIKESIAEMISKGDNKRTLPHEIGHTLGLEHINVKLNFLENLLGVKSQYNSDKNTQKVNIMYTPYKSDAKSVTPMQIDTIKEASKNGELNK